MTYQEIFKHLDAEPFRPFRIHMASGRAFDVRHPEMVTVGETFLIVVSFSTRDERLAENVEMLGLPLIESIETLELSVGRNQE